MKLPNPIDPERRPIHIVTLLRLLAADENCDGEPYDTMMVAADYIEKLEKEREP